jgi:hypothetical protein
MVDNYKQKKNKNKIVRKKPNMQLSNREQNRTRKQRQSVGATSRFGLPSRFPGPTNDVVPVTLKTAMILSADEIGVASGLIVYGKGASGAGYYFLDDIMAGFGSMCLTYSRFLIKRVILNGRVISNLASGGYLGMNYEPTNTNVANPPATLADVASAVHYDSGAPGVPAYLDFAPTDYFNDWRVTQGDSTLLNPTLTQMGVTQILAGGLPPSTSAGVVIDIEVEAYFCGYRL